MASWRQLKPGDPYFNDWSRYRQSTRWAHRGMLRLGGFLAATIVFLVVNEQTQLLPTQLMAAVGVILSAVGTALLGFADRTSRESLELACPRCGLPFLRGPSGENGFARQCLNCGLPKWEPRDPDAEGPPTAKQMQRRGVAGLEPHR